MILVALAMLLNSFYASYRVQRQTLIDNTLEANHIYAVKLASSTEIFLRASMQRLAYSASLQSHQFDDDQFLADETQRLLMETNSFNSIAVIDRDGVVKASAPSNLGVNGIKLDSEEVRQALQRRQTNISKPYVSAINNLIVSISEPIFRDGEYQGYVGGAVYLNKSNILHTLLDEHYYRNGSYIYVVDGNRRLLYHPEKQRIGTVVDDNELMSRMAVERDGSQRIVNSQGIDMLAGFAVIPATGWGIVAQRPVEETVAPLKGSILAVVVNAAPLAVVICILGWWLARVISRPLELLAIQARRMNEPDTANHIRHVRSWYFESAELKRAMLVGLGLLHDRIGKLSRDAETDSMTGLHNRRGLESLLELWVSQERGFAAITLDVDHFKKVNDQYGHDVGDQVLIKLAEMMRDCSRENDVLFRVGGEEFLMLLPDTSLEAARLVAERLRQKVEQTPIQAISVTISLGVALWMPEMKDASQVLKNADQKLYEAKSAGRNCVLIHEV